MLPHYGGGGVARLQNPYLVNTYGMPRAENMKNNPAKST